MKELSPGRDLWVLPDREHSDASAMLDWYLQFQISRALGRHPKQISGTLEELARQAEVELIDSAGPRIATDPMLIYSARLLPNRETLHLPYSENINEWLRRLDEIWSRLNKPSVRVFLPRGVKAEHFTGLKISIVKEAEFFTDTKLWT